MDSPGPHLSHPDTTAWTAKDAAEAFLKRSSELQAYGGASWRSPWQPYWEGR